MCTAVVAFCNLIICWKKKIGSSYIFSLCNLEIYGDEKSVWANIC